MQLLVQHGIDRIYHFAPLHYLPFIARDGQLKSKPVLGSEGFAASHFRSTSAHIDADRGFGSYVHLSTDPNPPILKAKLGSGFPHIGIELRTDELAEVPYDLCRFNIAKTRYLRRGGKPGFPECEANGQYYGELQIPVARTHSEKDRMLSVRQSDSMIEVLIQDRLLLNGPIRLRSYCEEDQTVAQSVLEQLGADWEIAPLDAARVYDRDQAYATAVGQFIDAALSDPQWRGNGLEFDRV